MKTNEKKTREVVIHGSELEEFHQKHPNACYWVNTGFGQQRIKKDNRGWYYVTRYYNDGGYFTESEIDHLPGVTAYIPL